MIPPATISISPIPGATPINEKIYGHFLESAFFGNIEGGVFDEGSPLSIDDGPLRGCRADVLEACRELGLPVVRWPGGNFTSPYWWQDGIGPRENRPRRLELAWGSEESNRFGTPEFLTWCEAVGTTPYLAHHARDVDDAVRWVEYTNYAGDTTLTRMRGQDGHAEPYGVRIWGLGNEVYGPWQMGHRSAAAYVEAAREHARFMGLVDPGLRFVAVGHHDVAWTQSVVAGLGDLVDYVSLHLYGASRHLIDPSEAEFDAVVAQAIHVEQAIHKHAETIRSVQTEHGRSRPLAIAMDEWNMRHLEPVSWPEPQPGADGGTSPRDLDVATGAGGLRVNRYSPRTLADALFYAGVFHAMHRASQLDVPVAMANTVNLVNANGLLAVRPGGLVKAATYHVWDLYQNHTGPIPLAATVLGPARTTQLRLGDDTRRRDGSFATRPAAVSLLDVSPSLSADRSTLHVAVINRSATDAVTARLDLAGTPLPASATVRTIGAHTDGLFVANSITEPDVVALSDAVHASLPDGRFTFAPHSVTLLSLQLG